MHWACVIDWPAVFNGTTALCTLALVVITGRYVRLTGKIMESSVVQAQSANATARLALEAHRDDRRRNAENILSTFSLIDMQIAWLMAQIKVTESTPKRHAARRAEHMVEPLKRSQQMLAELDELRMPRAVRNQLRKTNEALCMLIDAIPRALGVTPGYEMPEWELDIGLQRVNPLGAEILESAEIAMRLLHTELQSLVDENP